LRSFYLRRKKIPTGESLPPRCGKNPLAFGSLDELVRDDADLTQFPGIGAAIVSAIREIVPTRKLRELNTLRGQAAPGAASLAYYHLRVYKKAAETRDIGSAVPNKFSMPGGTAAKNAA
jgi:hypothetical protein